MPPPASASNPPHRQPQAPSTPTPDSSKRPLPSTSPSTDSLKRARSSADHTNPRHTPPAAATGTTMSTKSQGKRPAEFIDLTTTTHDRRPAPRAPALQSHMGPRRLVIKNLRVDAAGPGSAATASDAYFERTKAEISDALGAVFAGRPPPRPLERLYRGVEDLCRRPGEAHPKELATNLKQACDAFLGGQAMLGGVRGGGDGLGCLREVVACWKRWSDKLVVIRWIYNYLDRSYLLLKKPPQGVNEIGVELFRRAVFGGRKGDEVPPLGARVLAAVLELVELDRRGDARFDGGLLREAVLMMRTMEVYGKLWEVRFLEASHRYFAEVATEWSVNYGLKDYVTASQRLLEREMERCDLYNFDSTTKRELRDTAQRLLTVEYSEKLLDEDSVAKLLDAHDVGSMKALYGLLRQSGIQEKLQGPWQEYIRKTGAAILGDKERADDMIVRLLELRLALDIMVRDAFEGDGVFSSSLRDAFGHFINEERSSKVGEGLAKYIDKLLRGGIKTLPETLLSDARDRADAEMSGVASTAGEDAELERQLDRCHELFRFIQGKDVFEGFYKRDLARRLLMNRSASNDAERKMMHKLKSECGSLFTHNLEQMFRDQELARDEMTAYRHWLAGSGKANGLPDLDVKILSHAAWPSFPDVRVLLPDHILQKLSSFEGYYKTKHSGRKVEWKHALAHAVVRARFDKGPKELLVSALQAVVLVLFNEAEQPGAAPAGVLSYEQIAQATGLLPAALERTLQSLACGKVRILNKTPRGKEVRATDTFTVNGKFWDPKFRVKINQIQLKETKEENTETHKRIVIDRQYETQAAIVRLLKSRKSMGHAELVAEVINHTKSRGPVEPADIKVNIEKLIEKDYVEREGENYVYLA